MKHGLERTDVGFFKTLMIVYKKQKRAENLMNSARFCLYALLAVAFFIFLLATAFLVSS